MGVTVVLAMGVEGGGLLGDGVGGECHEAGHDLGCKVGPGRCAGCTGCGSCTQQRQAMAYLWLMYVYVYVCLRVLRVRTCTCVCACVCM
jgi:hypothetical protein